MTGSVSETAKGLLGSVIWTEFGDRTSVRITEVEAYGGIDDAASHAYRGRTPRNGSMFGPAGTLYVYRSYGIHWCANIVTGRVGEGQAVLVRAGEIVDGEDVIRSRRGRDDHLTDGPGKLTQALGITGEHDGTSVRSGPVHLELSDPVDPHLISATPRIGITREKEHRWRFTLLAHSPVARGGGKY